MSLANAVQGATHTPQEITWLDTEGQAVDLTGATMTGRIVPPRGGGPARDVAGALDVVDAEGGVFRWTYDAADVETAGTYQVQFAATYGDATKDVTLAEVWVVKPAY